MSYAGYKLLHAPTAVDFCAAAYLTHCPAQSTSSERIPAADLKYQDAPKASNSLKNNSKSDASVTEQHTSELSNLETSPPELVEPDDMDLLTSSPEILSTPWQVAGAHALAKRTVPPNLVIAKAHVLEVYYLRVGSPNSEKDSISGGEGEESKSYLELACEYRLHGNIASLAPLTHRADEGLQRRDAIILTFKDAKVSVLHFHDQTHSLVCSSLHFYEGPEWSHLKRGRHSFPRGPVVRADPVGRCAGVLLFDNQLMLLKAAQSGMGEEELLLVPLPSSTPPPPARITESYAVDLDAMGFVKIVDCVFLAGFNEPVVALLEEKEGGKLPCVLTALTLNLTLRQHPTLFCHAHLPPDVHSLAAVPGPLGGVLVLGASSIHYCSQTESCGLALSHRDGGGEPVQSLPRVSAEVEGVELDCAHVAWLRSDVAVIAVKTGAFLLLTLRSDGRSVRQLSLESSTGSSIPSCLVGLGPSHLFVGSRVGNSLLVRAQWEEEEERGGGEPLPKRAKRAEGGRFQFELEDTLVNIGPIRHLACGASLVACSGHGKGGSLSVLHRSVRLEVVTEEALEGCGGVWTVHGGEEGEHHALMLLSFPSSSMLFDTGDEAEQVTGSAFFTAGPTLCVGNLLGRCRVVQVWAGGVRLLQGTALAQHIPLEEVGAGGGGVGIASALVQDPLVLLTLTDGTLRLLEGGFDTSSDPVTASTLYLDQGPNFWLQKQCPHWSAEGDGAVVFFIACRKSGQIEILKLPEFESVWKAEAAVEGASLLLDAAKRGEGAGFGPDSKQGVVVREVVMERFGRSGSRPYLLLLLSDGQLLIYHSFSFRGGGVGGEAGGRRLGRLRWVRRPLEWECGEGGGMKVFHHGRHRGVFVCGPHPLWLMEHRQRLRAHPHEGDGPITAFAPLHNKHCPHGFIVTTGGGALKVGRLPPDVQFDNDWPLLKAMHPKSAVLTAKDREGGEEGEEGEDDSRLVGVEEFSLSLVVPPKAGMGAGVGGWKVEGGVKLGVAEHGLALVGGVLEGEEVVAVGTGSAQGEGQFCQGRILLFRAQQPLLQLACAEVKGPVSALAVVGGHLLAAVGRHLILHNWKGEGLERISFMDAPLYTLALASMRSYVLVGDLERSLQFGQWHEEERQLQMRGKDFYPHALTALEFLLHPPSLGLVGAGVEGSVHILAYAPQEAESLKGQKLVGQAGFHAGALISSLHRLPTHALLGGTTDGGVVGLAPLPELTHRRLLFLQRRLVDAVPHLGGLNPRAWRESGRKEGGGGAGAANIIDLELCRQYVSLDRRAQHTIATQIGSDRKVILNNLREFMGDTGFS